MRDEVVSGGVYFNIAVSIQNDIAKYIKSGKMDTCVLDRIKVLIKEKKLWGFNPSGMSKEIIKSVENDILGVPIWKIVANGFMDEEVMERLENPKFKSKYKIKLNEMGIVS